MQKSYRWAAMRHYATKPSLILWLYLLWFAGLWCPHGDWRWWGWPGPEFMERCWLAWDMGEAVEPLQWRGCEDQWRHPDVNRVHAATQPPARYPANSGRTYRRNSHSAVLSVPDTNDFWPMILCNFWSNFYSRISLYWISAALSKYSI